MERWSRSWQDHGKRTDRVELTKKLATVRVVHLLRNRRLKNEKPVNQNSFFNDKLMTFVSDLFVQTNPRSQNL